MKDLVQVRNMIYDIREQKVMVDFELAELYEVETKYLNRAVKRNIERLPKMELMILLLLILRLMVAMVI